MSKKLYVGNLPFSVTEDSLSNSFSAFGTVNSIRLITDRDTGRSKGFGFVEMSSDEEGARAIDELNGTQMDGRALTVSEAKPREAKSQNFGGSSDRENSYGSRNSAIRGY